MLTTGLLASCLGGQDARLFGFEFLPPVVQLLDGFLCCLQSVAGLLEPNMIGAAPSLVHLLLLDDQCFLSRQDPLFHVVPLALLLVGQPASAAPRWSGGLGRGCSR